MKINKYFLDFKQIFPEFKELIDQCSILTHRLLQEVDFEAGSFFTFLPDHADLNHLYDLKITGIAPVYQDEYSAVALLIQNFFKKKPRALAVFEDTIKRPSDRNLEVEGSNLAYFQKSVFFLLQSNASLNLIKKLLINTENLFQSLTILTEAPPPPAPHLKEADLDALCKHARYVITMAYDGDAYLIWESNHE